MYSTAKYMQQRAYIGSGEASLDPVYQLAGQAGLVAGDTYYVNANASNPGVGNGFESGFETTLEAITAATANNGDVIYVAPGHTEDVENATDFLCSKAGVSIIGLGVGSLIPTYTLKTATAATVAVTAANVRISGIKIISDLANVAAGITASAAADGLVVDNCILTDGAAAKELVIGVSLAALCHNCQIVNNDFLTVDGGGCASAVKFVGASNNTKIVGNTVFGDFSAGCLDLATAASTQVIVTDNLLRNADVTAAFSVDLNATSTGWVARNLCGTEGGAHGNAITAADMSVAENYASGDDGASGILEPGADS